MCSATAASFDDKDLANVAQVTKTDSADWSYPTTAGVEVHGAATPKAPVVDKLGLYLVRVLLCRSGCHVATWLQPAVLLQRRPAAATSPALWAAASNRAPHRHPADSAARIGGGIHLCETAYRLTFPTKPLVQYAG
jgi:hypothetical protein